MNRRSSGILMHITSLPGDLGIGTLGDSAYNFVDFLKRTEQSYWQILPLTTTSYGDSPYQSFSAIAGNTNLIDFYKLVEDEILEIKDFKDYSFGDNEEKINYELLFKLRRPILEKAVNNFLSKKGNKELLNKFIEDNSSWLLDYAEFMAIKEHFDNNSYVLWDEDIKKGNIEVRNSYKEKLVDKINYHTVTQYFFFKQWLALKEYANKNGIKIIGDMPIYVSGDSVEMWTMPELFKTNKDNESEFVAGVPADEFSPEGQLWGNPIYDWEYHKKTNYAWWVYRVKESFKLYDVLRIDHFKGFSDYWQIAKDAKTAKIGTWESGPGIELFDVLKQELGELPIIAENLGFIDEKAEKLLDDTGYPGMKILQFAFDDEESLDLPHNHTENSIVYTGTHDNEVVNGWYENLKPKTKEYVNSYISRTDSETITEAMMRTSHSSVCYLSVITMQDLLNKDASSRMNIPSTVGGNWEWRMLDKDLTEEKEEFLLNVTKLYGRARNK